MKEKHTKLFVDFFKDFHGILQERDKQLSDFFDKIIVWIIGLSTGSIVLIISSVEKLKALNKPAISVILLLLTISVVSGIVGRIFSAITTHISYSQASMFDFELKMLALPRDYNLDGTETTEMIYDFILNDFQIDLPELLTRKKNTPKEKWAELDTVSRKLYEDYSKMNADGRKAALAELQAITIEAFGLREDAFSKKRIKNVRLKGIVNRLLSSSSYFLYITSALIFCIALCYISYSYLQTIK